MPVSCLWELLHKALRTNILHWGVDSPVVGCWEGVREILIVLFLKKYRVGDRVVVVMVKLLLFKEGRQQSVRSK